MYKFKNPEKAVCVQEADGLTLGKEYLIIGNSSDSIDPFDFNVHVINDNEVRRGYYPWRFERLNN